jgi:hypothetical protein
MLNNNEVDGYDSDVEGSGDINYIQKDNALVKITINNKNGTCGNIYITEHCNPNELATSFVNKHQLSKSLIHKLESQIIERINIALEEQQEDEEDLEVEQQQQEEDQQQVIYRHDIIEQQQQQQQYQNYLHQENQQKLQINNNDNLNISDNKFNQSIIRSPIDSIKKIDILSIDTPTHNPPQQNIKSNNKVNKHHIDKEQIKPIDTNLPVDDVWDRFDRTNSNNSNEEKVFIISL